MLEDLQWEIDPCVTYLLLPPPPKQYPFFQSSFFWRLLAHGLPQYHHDEMPNPRSAHHNRDAEDTDSDTDQVVADQDDAMDKDNGHNNGGDDDMSEDGDSDNDASEARRREALEHMARIEKEFSELKDRLYQEKSAGFKREIDQITNGTHTEYMDQLNAMDRKKAEKLRLAELWRNYQIECIETYYRAEQETAESDHMTEQQNLREQMLSNLHEKLSRLEDEKTSLDLAATRSEMPSANEASQRQARRPRRRGGDQVDAKATKKRVTAGPQMAQGLKESEIQEDLLAIRKNLPQQTRRSAQKSMASFLA